MIFGHSVKKVFVTGGAGFIGSHAVDILINQGYQEPLTEQPDSQVFSLLEATQVILKRDELNDSSDSENLC